MLGREPEDVNESALVERTVGSERVVLGKRT